MNTKNHKASTCLLLLILFSSCGNHGKADPPTESDNKSLSIKIQIPTMNDAIQHIKTHIDRTVQKVMVPSFYIETVTKKKPCDQSDQFCSGAGPGAPYGYRNVTVPERRCCRPKEKSVYMIRGHWVANYLAPKDEWSVSLEYKDDAKQDQQINWSIKLDKSNGIQVSVD